MAGTPDSRINNSFGNQAVFVDTDMITYRKVFRYSVNQTDTTVLTPPPGYKLCIRGISSRSKSTVGEINMDFATSEQAVYDHYVTVNTREDNISGHIVGAVDEPLTINTTTGANDISISITYTYHE